MALCAAAFLPGTTSAVAHQFCVSTASGLQQALTQSSDGGTWDGEFDNYILVERGTYQTGAATGNGPFHYYSTGTRSLTITGGYDAACSMTSGRAAQTVLNGGGTTAVMSLRSGNGGLQVYDVTFENGQSDGVGAGLEVNYLTTVGAYVRVQNNIIRNNHSTTDAGGLYVSAAGEFLEVVGNLIYGNSADSEDGAGYVTGYGAETLVEDNTVTANTSAAMGYQVGGLYCGGSSKCIIQTNIFWNNTNCGIDLENAGLFNMNDVGTRCGLAPASNDANLSVSPKFVDAANHDYHLAGDSPLLGYALPAGPMDDIEGNAYPTTGKIDLGAYSETVFVDGFEGN